MLQLCLTECIRSAGTQLVRMAIETMAKEEADEVILEAEVSNQGALSLYTNLGFIRDKRLSRCAAAPVYIALCRHGLAYMSF